MCKLIPKKKITSPIAKYGELDPALCLELQKIVEALTAPGKGLLACDESSANLDERFQGLGIENTEVNRRDYREMLFSATQCDFSQYISGVILHHETIYQTTSTGLEFTEYLRQKNVIPGVKVDRGLVYIFGTQDESTTQGLDNLQERCMQYKKEGCHFAKWRCTFSISDTKPSHLAMVANANILARYASICQSARMVPIVETEVLNIGEHGINKSQQVHEEVLSILFRALNEHHIYLEGLILKSSMVLSGIKSTKSCTPQIIGEFTVTALRRTVPAAVPGIFFLSGGQSDEESILNLNSINIFVAEKPWRLSFCYGRALQNKALRIWQGKLENVKTAQAAFLEMARFCSEASFGKLQLEDIKMCVRNSADAK